jgi:tripartite-type tricarboxylate transporter receptor subunit TctC
MDRLNTDVGAVMKTPEVRDSLNARGFDAVGSTPEEYRVHLREELKLYARLVKIAGIRPE